MVSSLVDPGLEANLDPGSIQPEIGPSCANDQDARLDQCLGLYVSTANSAAIEDSLE